MASKALSDYFEALLKTALIREQKVSEIKKQAFYYIQRLSKNGRPKAEPPRDDADIKQK